MAQVGIAELLEAGVHFGHQTRRWNPKMRRFIHGERDGIYIIDLLKTASLLEQAQQFAGELAHRGGVVLFVGTKKQARDTIQEMADTAGMPYVNHRWLGGLLTNFQTISLRIRRLHDLERYEREGQLALLPTRERMAAQADLAKLRANLGGVKEMQRVPDAVFVIDLKTEAIAVREAQRLRIPIIGLVDTNCDPDGIDYVIPGNDDAIRSCKLITQAIGGVVAEGRSVFRAEEERARQEAEEKARREAEERAKREAEEQAKREAEEAAAAAAAAEAAAAAPPAEPTSAPPSAQPPVESAKPAAPPAPPAPVKAAPEPVPPAPEPVEAAPKAPESAPEPVEASPEPVEAAPEPAESAPAAVEPAAEAETPTPEAAEDEAAEPEAADAEPSEPEVAEAEVAQPEAATSEADVADRAQDAAAEPPVEADETVQSGEEASA